MNDQFLSRLFVILITVVLLGGCQRAPVKRTYHEIVQTAPQQPPPAMMPAFPLRPPEARFARGDQGQPMSGDLDMSSIPMDDVHAFLRDGQGVSAIPNDDIHASLGKGQGGASGAMPAFPLRPRSEASGEVRQGRPMTGAVDQQTQKMLEASVARPPLSWTTPQGWQETPVGGMRLVSFVSTDKDNPVECTIISLGGQAGGLESNAARWMKQVNIDVPAQAELEKFLAAQKKIKTQNGFDATIIDLTQLQSPDDLESQSMMATIIVLPDMTVFVKIIGTRGAVLKNRDKFETLCESLRLN